MPDLDDATPASGGLFYLDTSALWPLIKARQGPLKGADNSRQMKLVRFFDRVSRSGARAATSVLAMEEIAHRVRCQQRDDALARERRRGYEYSGWPDYAKSQPDAAKNDDGAALNVMLQILTGAVECVRSVAATIEQPPVDIEETATAAQQIRRLHRDLLRTNRGLDSMDALHIAFGFRLGAEDFVSFDSGWANVPKITVWGD